MEKKRVLTAIAAFGLVCVLGIWILHRTHAAPDTVQVSLIDQALYWEARQQPDRAEAA